MNDQASARDCDVLVIGGGPAGTTISALLAEKGWRVVILEKDHHPRFHIGESLLPMNLPIFERLGVLDQVEQIGIRKYGAEFNSMYHNNAHIYYFGKALDKNYPFAYEVKRAELDEILFRNAAEKGVETLEGMRVTSVDLDHAGGPLVEARDEGGGTHHWQARYLVDASGRGTFLANKFGVKTRNKKHSSAAVFGHFEGVERRQGLDEGNITLYWFDHGWFWFIPFKDGTMSVGAVCWPYYLRSRKGSVEQFLWDTIALCPPAAERCKNAKLVSPITATGNFAYNTSASHMSGKNYIIVGDAYAFIDPVFSSGVLLAMSGAVKAADVVDTALRDPSKAAARAREYQRAIHRALKYFSWFIYRITQPTMRNMFMGPRNTLRMEEGILSLLAGDLFRNTPVRLPLFAFKIVYYVAWPFHWRQNMAALRKRKRALRNRETVEESTA